MMVIMYWLLICLVTLTRLNIGEAYELSIMATREIRGRMLPGDGNEFVCPLSPIADGDCIGADNAINCVIGKTYCITSGKCGTNCVGGLMAFVKSAEDLRNEKSTVLTLDPGNFYFGTEHLSADNGTVLNSLISNAVYQDDDGKESELLYDAMGMGVSDFIDDLAGFNALMSTSPIQRVVSNYDFSAVSELATCVNLNNDPCIVDYLVLQKGAKQIGILGASTPNIANLVSNFPQNAKEKNQGDIVRTLRETFQDMQTQYPGLDVVVLLSTLSEADTELVAVRCAGIDVIVSNADLKDVIASRNADDDRPGFVTLNEFPNIVRNAASGHPVHIFSGVPYGRGFSRLDVTFDDSTGVITSYDAESSGRVLPIVSHDPVETAFDAYTYERVKAFEGELLAKSAQVVGTITRKMYGHWGDGNDKGNEEDYRGLGCRFPEKLQTESDTCDADKEKLPFLLLPQESATREACCPFAEETERACASESCEPTVDPITNEWSYPKSNGREIDACCKFNPYRDGDSDRGCCPMNVHWEVFGCRNSDCPFGRFTTDALMYHCKECDMVFTNGASIRGNLEGPGPDSSLDVTYSDLSEIFSFGNSFATFDVEAQVLVEIMRHGVFQYQAYYGGNYNHMSGARIVFHAGLAKLFRLELCSRWNRDTDQCDGEWNDAMDNPNRMLRIGTNNYIREGNSGYTMIGDSSNNMFNVNDYGYKVPNRGSKIVDYVANFLRIRSPFTPPTMAEIQEACGGYIHNFVDHWRRHPECRSLKAAVEFPETCPVNETARQNCLANAEGTFELGGLELVRPANSSCYECSGFGTCNPGVGYRCDCSPVQATGFSFPRQYRFDSAASTDRGVCSAVQGAGMVFMRGDSCHVPRTREPAVALGGLVGAGLSALCYLSSAAAFLQVLRYRNHVITRVSLGPFTALMAFGGFMGGSFVLIAAQEPSATSCTLQPFLAALACGLLLGPCVVKFQYINSILLKKRYRDSSRPRTAMRTRVLSMRAGYTIVLVICAVEIVICSVLSATVPFLPTLVEMDESVAEWGFTVVCASQNEFGSEMTSVWLLSLAGFNGLLVLYAVYVSNHLRAIHLLPLREVRWLAFAMYNVVLICSAMLPITIITENDPFAQSILRDLCMTLCVVCTMVCLVMSKYKPLRNVSEDATLTGLFTKGYITQNSYANTGDLGPTPFAQLEIRRTAKEHPYGRNAERGSSSYGSNQPSSFQPTSIGI